MDRETLRLEQQVAAALRGHIRDFLSAIDERSRPVSDIEQGHIAAVSCILANLSPRLGRTLAFDPESHTVTGDEEATGLLRRPSRASRKHPAG